MTEIRLTPEQIDRFLANITPRATPDGCEEWKRARMGGTHHYGQVRVNGKLYYAHRISYQIHHGPVSPGLRVLHRCDNPPCQRKAHLFAGTAKDNSVDMRDKGRWGNRPFPGSSNGFAKLDEDKARAILVAYDAGATQVELASLYGVTQATISLVVRRETWRHVGPTALAAQYGEAGSGDA